MKRGLKAICLAGLGLWFLACTLVGGPEERSPATTTSAPEQPVATRTPLPVPSVTPTAAPTATRTPAAVLDFSEARPPYRERAAWRALLGWPDDCEEGFQLIARQPEGEGGIAIYPVAEERYLVFVSCLLGPYWVEERPYWVDNRTGAPVARPLSVPELLPGAQGGELSMVEVDVLHGSFPAYDPETQTLTNLAAERGLKDCGTWYKYYWEQETFVLVEARYQACADEPTFVLPQEWPLIYPATADAERAGPFRQVSPLPAELGKRFTGLTALSNGGLRLLVAAWRLSGYATFRGGLWTTQLFADDERILLGVDAAGRPWFTDKGGAAVYYQDRNGLFVPASDGWEPLWDALALKGLGVVTDHRGQVWLATGQDVRVFDGQRWTVFTRAALGMSAASKPNVLTGFVLIFVPGTEQIWVGACDWGGEEGVVGGGGARWFDGLTWHGAATPVADGCVTAIAADAQGHVWIGLDQGLVQDFNPATGQWRQSIAPAPEGYRQAYAATLTLDPAGAPWLLAELTGQCRGAGCDTARALYHFQDGAWVAVAGSQDEPTTQLYTEFFSPLFDGTGTPWLLLSNGVTQIEDNRVTQPVANLYGWIGTVDADGRLWVVGRRTDDEPLALWVLDSSTGGSP